MLFCQVSKCIPYGTWLKEIEAEGRFRLVFIIKIYHPRNCLYYRLGLSSVCMVQRNAEMLDTSFLRNEAQSRWLSVLLFLSYVLDSVNSVKLVSNAAVG